MKPEVQNIGQAFEQISEYWSPALLAQLNGQDVRVVKLMGTFPWHSHEQEDELFLVLEGNLKIETEEGDILLNAGELVVIPRGLKHRPVAEEEVKVILFEPSSTLNTGDQENAFTKRDLKDLR